MSDFYQVLVERVETIEFRVQANSVEEAEERYLLDGEEVGSTLNGTSVIHVGWAASGSKE